MPGPFDDQAKRRYIRVLEQGRPRKLAAADLGFSWNTVAKHLREDPEFREQFNDALDRRIERIEEVGLELAEDGHFGAIKFMLERLSREKYGDPTKGQGGGPTSVTQVAIVTTDALRELLSGDDRDQALGFVNDLPVLEAEVVDG